jgi:hypothetical protein
MKCAKKNYNSDGRRKAAGEKLKTILICQKSFFYRLKPKFYQKLSVLCTWKVKNSKGMNGL